MRHLQIWFSHESLLPLGSLSLLLVLGLQSPVIFLRVLQRVTNKFHPQGLEFNLFDFFSLQRHFQWFHDPLGHLSHLIVQQSHMFAHLHLFLERFVKLQHVEVGHEHEVIHRCFFQSLDYEVIHDHQIIEHECDTFRQEQRLRVVPVGFGERLDDGDDGANDVVELKDPDEPNFGAPAEDIIVGYFSLFAGMEEFLVGGQLHEVVIHRNQQFLMNELLQLVRFGLQLVMPVFGGLGKGFYLFVQDDIADVVFRYF